MIINEVCYEQVKKTFLELKTKFDGSVLPPEQRNGSLVHEIEIRERDLSFYEDVISGRAKLPELNSFKSFGKKLIEMRIAKNLSARQVAGNCGGLSEQLSEIDIIGLETFDYLPATFDVMLSIYIAIDEMRENGEGAFTVSVHQEELQDSLLEWRETKEAIIKKTFSDELQGWWHLPSYSDLSPGRYEAWKGKIESLGGVEIENTNQLRQYFLNFSEVLVMWRLGKKWSYKQLAEACGLDWLMIWFFERRAYHGVLYSTMLRIADVVEHGDHEPSESSFDPEDVQESE